MPQRVPRFHPSSQHAAPPALPSPRRRRLLGWALGSGVGLLGGGLASHPRPPRLQAQPAPSIVGAWLMTVTSQDPTDDAAERDVVSFTADGLVLASNPPSLPPAPDAPPGSGRTYRTASQGSWLASSPGQVRFTLLAVDTDEQGTFLALVQVTATASVDSSGSSLSGRFQVRVTGAEGSVLYASPGDEGSFHGTRITG